MNKLLHINRKLVIAILAIVCVYSLYKTITTFKSQDLVETVLEILFAVTLIWAIFFFHLKNMGKPYQVRVDNLLFTVIAVLSLLFVVYFGGLSF